MLPPRKKNISLTNTSLADKLNLQKSNLNYIILSKKQTQQINTDGRLAIKTSHLLLCDPIFLFSWKNFSH
jgi:hypothetical protein